MTQSHVGELVSVLLGIDEQGTPKNVVGILVSLTVEGDVVIDTPEGRMHCWPALKITPGELTGPPPCPLRPEDVRTLQLVEQGLTNKAISAVVYNSPETIKSRLTKLGHRFGTSDRMATAAYARARGWL